MTPAAKDALRKALAGVLADWDRRTGGESMRMLDDLIAALPTSDDTSPDVGALEREYREALEPFAKFACTPWGSCRERESHAPCHNCTAHELIHRAPESPTEGDGEVRTCPRCSGRPTRELVKKYGCIQVADCYFAATDTTEEGA